MKRARAALASFWPPCQDRSQLGSPAWVCFTWGTMQWASLWPSSVIKTGVSLVAQSALFCAPSPAVPGTPGYPLFPSARSAFVCPLGLPVTASFTRSLALFLLRFVGSGRPSSATRARQLTLSSPVWIHPLYFWLTSGLLSMLRFGVSLRSLSFARTKVRGFI